MVQPQESPAFRSPAKRTNPAKRKLRVDNGVVRKLGAKKSQNPQRAACFKKEL